MESRCNHVPVIPFLREDPPATTHLPGNAVIANCNGGGGGEVIRAAAPLSLYITLRHSFFFLPSLNTRVFPSPFSIPSVSETPAESGCP